MMSFQSHSNYLNPDRLRCKTPSNHKGFEDRPFSPDAIEPRQTYFKFSPEIPKLWVDGESYAYAHLLNAFNLFVPHREVMVAHTIRTYIDNVNDTHLKHQMRGFIAQEIMHGQAHAKFQNILRSQGYKIDGFLQFSHWFYNTLMPKLMGTKICLAITAAFEQYVAAMIIKFLGSNFLDNADPQAKELFQWHSIEEVEHHVIPYEVLSQVDNSYLLRLVGAIGALIEMFTFNFLGAFYLLAQDKQLFSYRTWQDLGQFLFEQEYGVARLSQSIFLQYIRPNYHPFNDKYFSQITDLARNFLINHATV